MTYQEQLQRLLSKPQHWGSTGQVIKVGADVMAEIVGADGQRLLVDLDRPGPTRRQRPTWDDWYRRHGSD
ncbi:MAG: hypothetical protein HYY29_03845 [Chloroflexi bacterium]|nr:hypothetical protein [Chloroflexota bacterium]